MSNSSGSELSMKWHRFLIYFALWAAALLQVASGARLLSGSNYGSVSADQVYAVYPGLKSVDMLFGVLSFVVAAYLIYTRFQLAGFRQGAPNKLLIAYGLSITVSVGFLLAASGATGLSLNDLADESTWAGVASSIAMLFVNRLYYQKRAHLFGESAPSAPGNAGKASAPPAQPVKFADRFCTRCGKKADPEDRFCTGCGAALE